MARGGTIECSDKAGVRTREHSVVSQDERENERQERVEHDACVVERPSPARRRSRRRRRLIAFGRGVVGRRRGWKRGRRRLGHEFIVERAAHAVARSRRGPRD
eukprot:6212576-Pleurochrysis_carterae.AAC.4